MPQTKTIPAMFDEIGLEKKSDRNTLKNQIIEYLVQRCGSKEQASELKEKGLRNTLDQFLDTAAGRHHFPRQRNSEEWGHWYPRDDVMETLTKITKKWLPRLKRKVEKNTTEIGKSPKQDNRSSKTFTPPNRMAVIEMEAEQADRPHDQESEELPDLEELFVSPSRSAFRNTREETIRADSVASTVDTQVQLPQHAAATIVPGASTPVFQAINSPSTGAVISGALGTKRKHHDRITMTQEQEEETEDSSDEDDRDEPTERNRTNKRPRLDHSQTPSQRPGTSHSMNNRETSTEYADAHHDLPMPASPSEAETAEQTTQLSYHITLPAHSLAHSTSEDPASFWPNLVTSMIRRRQHTARSRLDAERAMRQHEPPDSMNELDEDGRIVDAVSRVLQNIHDDVEVIRMVMEGRREEYEDTVRRRQ